MFENYQGAPETDSNGNDGVSDEVIVFGVFSALLGCGFGMVFPDHGSGLFSGLSRLIGGFWGGVLGGLVGTLSGLALDAYGQTDKFRDVGRVAVVLALIFILCSF